MSELTILEWLIVQLFTLVFLYKSHKFIVFHSGGKKLGLVATIAETPRNHTVMQASRKKNYGVHQAARKTRQQANWLGCLTISIRRTAAEDARLPTKQAD